MQASLGAGASRSVELVAKPLQERGQLPAGDRSSTSTAGRSASSTQSGGSGAGAGVPRARGGGSAVPAGEGQS